MVVSLNPLSIKILEPRSRALLVNLDTGFMHEVEGAVWPVARRSRFLTQAPDGNLWYGEGGTLIQWDPVAGTSQTIMGRGRDVRD